MLGAPSARDEEQARLSAARTEFVASLPRRLEVLRRGLTLLEEDPGDGKRQHGLLRRVHALAASARVLGFATVAEVLVETERAVRRASRPGNQALAFQDITRALDLLPSLVLGAGAPPRPLGAHAEARALERAYPISVLLFGTASLASALTSDESERFELEHTEDSARARALARTLGPDVLIVDADRPEASGLVEELLGDAQVERVPLIVLGSFDTPEAATAFVTRGAERVLPKPVSPDMLRRAVFELHELAAHPGSAREPLGELTVDALADRLAQEIHKGLVGSVEAGGQSTLVELGAGVDVLAAIWGALARVRELVTVRSKGAVRFQPLGPEGAIPFAPLEERRSGERSMLPARGAEDVSLAGRRILVVDDDPAVVWFMGGLFKAVGAEVIEAHDGRRALELAFKTTPDVVVSDILMPGYDGFALCHEIKRDVVTRDIPVVLLSWKEDLLQRVRELGAGADGYLRKEATASTVVERVREVLRPRARVEQRLANGGEARGRLDGLTPRFVIERVCRAQPDATVRVRDAAYLYEVSVRGGKVVAATRTASDGSFERGERVLAGLLGVNAGRFTVEPDSSPCRADFEEPLEVLLERHVSRARSALAALSAERLTRVTRVEVDGASVAGYAECSPEWARRVVDQLANGISPREILMEGSIMPRLLEFVLSDLARRGAVRVLEHEAFTPASSRVSEPAAPASGRASAASDRAVEPASGRAVEPASDRAVEPASDRAVEPASDRAVEPASDRAVAPVISANDSAVAPAVLPESHRVVESAVAPVGSPASEPAPPASHGGAASGVGQVSPARARAATPADEDDDSGWFGLLEAQSQTPPPPDTELTPLVPSPVTELTPLVPPNLVLAERSAELPPVVVEPEPGAESRAPATATPPTLAEAPPEAANGAEGSAEKPAELLSPAAQEDAGAEELAPAPPAVVETRDLGQELGTTLLSEQAPERAPSPEEPPAQEEPKPEASSQQAERAEDSPWRTGVLAAVAFVLAYVLVRFLLVPTLEPEKDLPESTGPGDSGAALETR